MKMRKNLSIALIASIALLLITIASLVNAESSTGYLVACFGLMAAYCVGQYRLSKNYR